MSKIKDLDGFVGRRLRIRDLHVFSTVARTGSMAKAAAQLGVSQPAVSEVVGSLEHALRVRLFDRKPQGVELTLYGQALLERTRTAFDELKQGVRDIEGLADPAAGEIRIGCPESIATGILPPVIQRFNRQYPRAVVHLEHVNTVTLEVPQLRQRSLDLVLARMPVGEKVFPEDMNVEVLFDDYLVVAVGERSRWAKRRRIELAELVDEQWILAPLDAWNSRIIAEAFASKGLKMPKISLITYSMHLRTNLLANGDYITTFPNSVLRLNADWFSLKVLPLELPARSWPVLAVTLKNRTLSPIVQRFLEHVREQAKSMVARFVSERKAG